jgi:hemerythrin-like domain-containing protein
MSRVTGIAPPGTLGPGFEEPFGMLEACHERVERMLALLGKLRAHMRTHGADEQARQAARDVMRYFDKAAPQHHLDEELHVFPVLVGLRDEALTRLVARLQRDHQEMAARWAAVRSLLGELEGGERTQFNEADDAVIDGFAVLYADHMQAEEGTAFPRASGAMDGKRLQEMSGDMMSRRGVTVR